MVGNIFDEFDDDLTLDNNSNLDGEIHVSIYVKDVSLTELRNNLVYIEQVLNHSLNIEDYSDIKLLYDGKKDIVPDNLEKCGDRYLIAKVNVSFTNKPDIDDLIKMMKRLDEHKYYKNQKYKGSVSIQTSEDNSLLYLGSMSKKKSQLFEMEQNNVIKFVKKTWGSEYIKDVFEYYNIVPLFFENSILNRGDYKNDIECFGEIRKMKDDDFNDGEYFFDTFRIVVTTAYNDRKCKLPSCESDFWVYNNPEYLEQNHKRFNFVKNRKVNVVLKCSVTNTKDNKTIHTLLFIEPNMDDEYLFIYSYNKEDMDRLFRKLKK